MDDEEILAWLLDSDPALRWQVERDLMGAPEAQWAATRARVATEGFGAQLLARQDPDGQWAGGAFFPAGHDFRAGVAQPWTATSWSLSELREWGLDAAVLGDTAQRLAAHSRWEYRDRPYWGGEVDCCINAGTLANGAWLGVDMTSLAEWFPEHAMDDGGWNCEGVNGARRSSFHSTLNSLVGLLEYEARTGDSSTRAARAAGEQYLLERRLLYRRDTGEPVGPWTGVFAYPFRWPYSALKAVDYFRAAAGHDSTPPDPRLADAVELIRAARDPDGRWRQGQRHGGRAWFEVDAPVGEPSRWLTFLSLRALAWWDAGSAPR